MANPSLTIPDNTYVPIALGNWKDAEGQAASAPTANPSYTSSDPHVASIVNHNGAVLAVSAFALQDPSAIFGTATITGVVQNDAGQTVSAELDLTVVASSAVSAAIVSGQVMPYPPA